MIKNLAVSSAVVAAIVAVSPIGPAPAALAQALDDTPWTLPVTPPRCTTSQANSGDVGDCLLAFYEDPSDTGWGTPPAPGVGPGWTWSGYRYNGSEALTEWEATRIGSNAAPIGPLGTGTLETHVDAQALFEGFLTDVTAGGYEVNGASGYGFRCTSGNGGWNCPSGDPNDLSNHAWGLAIDMNSGTNPIKSYSGVDGATACATPMVTDMPRWVIETAERWGLYWGGYGWNNGCKDPTTERSSVYRDPPHFEFRGTTEQAQAIAAFNIGNDPLAICRATVDDAGNEVESCSRDARPAAHQRLPIEVDAPDDAVAAMINLTAVDATGPGFLTLEDCGPRSSDPSTSAITFPASTAIATMAVVPLDDDGRFCVYRSTAVHSIVDVVAYIGAGDDARWVSTTTPQRLTDTRESGACRPGDECRPGPVPDDTEHLVTAEADDIIANLAVIDGLEPGYLQAGACDAVGADANFSNLNYMGSDVRSNLALIDADDTGSCVYALSAANVIVDQLALLDEHDGFGWRLAPSRRVLDTRECTDAWCDDMPTAGRVIELDLGSDAAGAAIAITVTDTRAPGFVAVGNCDDLGGGSPNTSNLNHLVGQTVTNVALTSVDDGKVCLFTLAPAHVIVDVQAELVDDHELGLIATTPHRVHDSRES